MPFWLCNMLVSVTFLRMSSDSLVSNEQEAVQSKGLRDDTTCIVVDILPQEKPAAPLPPPKKPVKGMFKAMFRKKASESSSHDDKEYMEPDVVEELFEEGSAMLSERFVIMRILYLLKYEICTSIVISSIDPYIFRFHPFSGA